MMTHQQKIDCIESALQVLSTFNISVEIAPRVVNECIKPLQAVQAHEVMLMNKEVEKNAKANKNTNTVKTVKKGKKK